MNALTVVKTGSKALWRIGVQHAPEILQGMSIIGFWSAGIIAVKVTPKVMEELRTFEWGTDKERYLGAAKIIGKYYWCPLTLGMLSSFLSVKSLKVNKKRLAAAIAALKISQDAMRDIREESEKTVGEKKTEEIFDKAIINNGKKVASEVEEIESTGLGDQLWIDETFGRKFRISPENMKTAMLNFMQRIWNDECASVGDFYDIINLRVDEIQELMGYNIMDFDEATRTYWEDFMTNSPFIIRAAKDDLSSFMIISWHLPDGSMVEPAYNYNQL